MKTERLNPSSKIQRVLRLAVAVAAVWMLPTVHAGSAREVLPLFDFGQSLATPKLATQDATVALSKDRGVAALRIATGRNHPWPGVTLPAPHEKWDLRSFGDIAVSVRNTGSNAVTVHCRADNANADGSNHCVTGALSLRPGASGVLKVALKRVGGSTLDGKLFGMRGYPVASGGPGTLDPSQVTQLLIFVSKPASDHVFEVNRIVAEGEYTPSTAWTTDADPYFPFIDTFGQYRHKDWPGKTHSAAELRERRQTEARELAASPAPKDWDPFGGWASGPQLSATGFFRVEKYRGQWWLIDPAGRLFWSHGIDCVRMMDVTPVGERESWFEDFPGTKPEFGEFNVPRQFALKGHYAGRSPKCFSFAGANLLRKYGSDWKHEYRDVIQRRLRSWGLNTIGNWSDETTRLMRRTPYTDAVSSGRSRRIEGSDGYWGKFPDPFDPQFRDQLRASMAAKTGKSAGDAWCIGYFSDNEIAWGDEYSLAIAALRSPPSQEAKKVFVADLTARHGSIAALNAAWGAAHASWDALLESRAAPTLDKAREDLGRFYTRIAEQYFRTARDVIREAAPKQLYLGCRFAWVNARAAAAAAKYCDVVSYNLYRRSVADFQFNGGADVPLIIGEFHFGALDRGMFHTGLVPVANQADRARTYRSYVEGALRHPQFVGAHWFQYLDEPVTGRVYDEENYQIGFVDVADTPYTETIAACRDVAAALYRTRLNRPRERIGQ